MGKLRFGLFFLVRISSRLALSPIFHLSLAYTLLGWNTRSCGGTFRLLLFGGLSREEGGKVRTLRVGLAQPYKAEISPTPPISNMLDPPFHPSSLDAFFFFKNIARIFLVGMQNGLV